MEEQANLKDLLKQCLQDFFSLHPTITPPFSAVVGKDFFKMLFSFHGWKFPFMFACHRTGVQLSPLFPDFEIQR